jgi:YidC/Oxa1 family membrane protein insertase
MDFKKTILWAVFSMSGLMLYNNWQVHEGKPSLFGGAPASAPAAADKAVATNKVDVPAQISGSPAVAATPAVNSGAIESAEKFTLQNDVLVLEISASAQTLLTQGY